MDEDELVFTSDVAWVPNHSELFSSKIGFLLEQELNEGETKNGEASREANDEHHADRKAEFDITVIDIG